jgi:hypothetical protein
MITCERVSYPNAKSIQEYHRKMVAQAALQEQRRKTEERERIKVSEVNVAY